MDYGVSIDTNRPDDHGKEGIAEPSRSDGPPGYDFTVLRSFNNRLAAKRITPTKTYPYGKEIDWVFYPHSLSTHAELVVLLKQLATLRLCCIVRGWPVAGLDLKTEHRRLSEQADRNTLSDPPRAWLVFDLDDVQVSDGLGSPLRLRRCRAGVHSQAAQGVPQGEGCCNCDSKQRPQRAADRAAAPVFSAHLRIYECRSAHLCQGRGG
jgi:hypothetical protein